MKTGRTALLAAARRAASLRIEAALFEIDMMDENADQMNAQLEKPAVMDVNGWFRQGAVLPTHVISAHVRIAQDKQWLGNDNRVNTRYMQSGW